MKRRCGQKDSEHYHYYGGRGISVCGEWLHDFGRFISDMGRRPSKHHMIERIDNDKGYSPDNCKWATRIEQGHNKRNNRWLTFNGETLTITDWAARLGLGGGRDIIKRLTRGWTLERALTLGKQNPFGR